MATSAKSVGTRFEREVREYLRDKGFLAEKLALSGTEDEGDIVVDDPLSPGAPTYVMQLKARRDLKTPLSLHTWLRDATVQAHRYQVHRKLLEAPVPLLVVKNSTHGTADSFLIMALKEFVL